MHHSRISTPLLFTLLAACSSADSDTLRLSQGSRAALAQLGVMDVQDGGDSFVLADEDGEPVGEVRLGDGATVTSKLHDDVAQTTKLADGTVVECNGASASFDLTSDAVPADARATIEPCGDALDVAAILIAADEGIESDDQHPRNLAHCTFLGGNVFCQGTTSVVSFDSLCMNDPSDPFTNQWVETTTWYTPNGASCTNS